MLLRHMNATDLRATVLNVSAMLYGNNLVVHATDGDTRRFPSTRFVLRVSDSKGHGARRAASGRRTVAACWHAHRDVMHEIFAQVPTARITSALADYKGRANFLADFPATADHRAGSLIAPVRFADLCVCEATGRGRVMWETAPVDLIPATSADSFRMRFDTMTAEAEAEMEAWSRMLKR